MSSFVTHMECSETGERHDADVLHNLSRAGAPLLVRYDLPRLARSLSKEDLLSRPADMWRYGELLPLSEDADLITLGEAMTPLIALHSQTPDGGELLVTCSLCGCAG